MAAIHAAIPLLSPLFSSQCYLNDDSQYGGSAHLRPSKHADLIRIAAGDRHYIFTSRAVDASADEEPENQESYEPHLVDGTTIVIRAAV